jgi:hypothetical protein
MKKFKDCSREELNHYCKNVNCNICKLYINNVPNSCIKQFVEHKDLLSDKMLNIELPIDNEILDDVEKKLLTKIVKFYNKMHCEVVYFKKNMTSQEHYYINFGFKYDKEYNVCIYVCLPIFNNKNMYKNMKLDEPYTLEELGIEISKNKITINEFFKLRDINIIGIHCNTEAKANALCKAFDKAGQKWCDGTSYLSDNEFVYYGKDTCYTNDNYVDHLIYLEMEAAPVIEFEDVDLT